MGINHEADREVADLIARLRNRPEPADEPKEFYEVPDVDYRVRRQQQPADDPFAELDEALRTRT